MEELSGGEELEGLWVLEGGEGEGAEGEESDRVSECEGHVD